MGLDQARVERIVFRFFFFAGLNLSCPFYQARAWSEAFFEHFKYHDQTYHFSSVSTCPVSTTLRTIQSLHINSKFKLNYDKLHIFLLSTEIK